MSDAASHLETAQRLRGEGDLYEAAVHQRRAIALLRDAAAGPLTLGHALRHLAEILVEGGTPDEAAAPVAEMLALYRANADVPPLERANALRCAALVAGATGDAATARAFWSEAYLGYETLGIDAGMAEAQARIAASRG